MCIEESNENDVRGFSICKKIFQGFYHAMESVTQDIEQYTVDALYSNSYTNDTVGIQCSNPVRFVM